MAAHLARTLSPQELIEKGICPVKKEYIVDETITRKEMEAVGSVVAEKPAAKKSNTQKKKESKAKAKEQLCFHHLRGTCTFGADCKFKHDLTDYVRRKPQDLPGQCPFSCSGTCPYSLTCRWATKHKNPDELTKKWLINQDVAKDGSGKLDAQQVSDSMAPPRKQSVANVQRAAGSQQNEASALDTAAKDNMNGAAVKSDNGLGKEVKAEEVVKTEGATAEVKTKEAVTTDVGTVQVKPEAAVKAEGIIVQSDAQEDPATVEHQGLQMYVLPVPTEIKPVQNQITAVVGHDLRKHTYDFSRADNVLKALGVSNNLKMRDRKSKKKAADAQVDEKYTRGDLIKSSAAAQERTPESKATSAEPEAQQAVKKQKVESGEGTIPIYDISKSSNIEGGIVNQRDGTRRIDFAGKLYCAPLTTTGNLPFRRIVKQFGCDITCGEMALTSNLLQGQQSEWALLKRHPCEDLFGVQICGAHPDSVARCVQLLDDNLALDFIDLNMGCPIDLICNKGMGSALLQRPKRFAQVVQAAAKTAQNCVVTFKTRTGFYDKQRTAAELLKDVGPWGVAAVTVHGRTRAQRYSKLADWDYVEHCAAIASPAKVQVIGNGDVFSFEDYEAHMKSGNLASCMIARGALIKPWLFTEIKERRHWDISATERLDMLKEYCKHGLEHWGSDEKGVENTRRFLLEWLSFLCRYVPVGLLEVLPQNMTSRPPAFKGRSDLETLLSSNSAQDWVRITEMLLGPAPEGFVFMPKHKSNSYETVKAGEEEVQG